MAVCECGAEFTPRPGPGRPRKRCEACGPSRAKQQPGPQPSLAPTAPIGVPEAMPRKGLVGSIEDRLEKAQRESTPEGVIALGLAELLAAGGHTASGAASLARELRATLDAALAGAPKAADIVDELQSRRERRRGA